ncbi:hypothetical protein REPUB_Repub02eG0232900 [Reevesia pubescens]
MNLVKCFHSIVLAPSRRDRLIWEHDSKGQFSVKKFSSLINNEVSSSVTFDFCRIWNVKIPPNVQCFLWMTMLNRIPTKSFLRARGINISLEQSLCIWCKLEVEDDNHLLLLCPWIGNFWSLFFQWWNISLCLPSSISSFLLWCLDPVYSSPFKFWWISCCAAALWTIWLARNEAVFVNKVWCAEEILFLVKLRSLSWINAACSDPLTSDSLWWLNPLICQQESLSIKNKYVAVWSPPGSGFVKFNVDAAVNSLVDAASCGGVLRGADGNILALFYGPLERCDVNVAEVMAIKLALEVFLEANLAVYGKLQVESDSSNAVN